MSIFKKIGNALGIKNHTLVGKILKTDISNKNNSTAEPSAVDIHKYNNQLKNASLELVNQVGINKTNDLTSLDLSGVLNQKTQTKEKTFVGGLLSNMWGSLKDGLGLGLKNSAQTGIDYVTGKLINTGGVQSSQNAISDYATGVMETTMAKYIKRNWFYILLPVVGLFFLGRLIINPSNGKKRPYRRK